jgi:hypothetical protein
MHIKPIPLLWPLNNTEYRDVGAQKVKLGHLKIKQAMNNYIML